MSRGDRLNIGRLDDANKVYFQASAAMDELASRARPYMDSSRYASTQGREPVTAYFSRELRKPRLGKVRLSLGSRSSR